MLKQLKLVAILVTVCVLQGLWSLAPAHAFGKLEQIKNAKLTVANVNEHSEACGLSRDAMREAFLQPLRNSSIQITKSSAYFFYIKTTTIPYVKNTCITYVNAELLLTERYFNSATRSEKSGIIRLWSRGVLYTSGKSQHPEGVNSKFRELGRDFLQAWQRDQ